MGLLTATFVVAAATLLTGLAVADYSSKDRPRIVLDNGNMVFQVPRSRNITFRTSSGRGGIFLNGRDVADVLDKVAEASRTLEPIARNNQLQALGETVESVATLRTEVTEIKEKCQALQAQVRRIATNLTRTLRVPLVRLQRQVRNLRNSLTQDPCRSNPCSHGGSCIGRYNAYTCLCPPAWEGRRCEVDVDECTHLAGSDLGCQNGARCINTPGSYRCECAQSYYGARCTEHEASCTTATSSALCDHGTCVSLPQTNNPPYMCLCDQGWTKGFGQPSCSVDVDECATGHHFCSRNPPVACINFPGGFGCGPCPSGYTGDGYSCADIDECLTNNGGCSQNPRVDCFNTVGSRFCGPCPPGYVGDGVSCSYVGACNVNNGGCSPLARCIVRSGGFHECLCPPGYVGGGVGPSGCLPQGEPGGGGGGGGAVAPSPLQPPLLDPCAAHPCSNGFCQPRGNGFACICETGYSGRLCDRARDACASEPCLNNGTCSSRPGGSFACSCTPEWTGAICDEPRQSCEDTLYGQNGTLRYPETGEQYAHKRDCIWVVHTAQEKVLNLTFTAFHVEEGHECAFDYLEIHDGPTSTRRTIGRYCGTTLSGTSIVSGQPAVYLHFHSDSSVAGDGFTIEWTSVDPQCGKVMPEANVGSVSSPGYPDHYPSNRNCMWTLTVPAGKRIQLHLATVQMEHHPNCSYDYLKIYDGATDQDRVLATFCGTNNSASERPILSSGHNMLVQFRSDESSTDTGFYATYAAVPAVPGCGGVMSRDKGRFSSPGHPSPYENGLLCEWEIRASPGERLRLSFERFDIEGHPACRWDALEVFDGRDDRSPLLRRACGDSVPSPVMSSGDSLFVRFKTDENTQLQGFSAFYETVCGGRWTGLQGELTSPRYPSVYPRNRHCNYTIVLPPGNVVQLAVQTFDVERDDNCGYDYLEISEPARNGSTTRIGRYCGSTPPPLVTSSYNQLRLVFHTDHSNEHHGFLANYTALDVGCGGVLTEAGSLASPATRSASSADSDADSSGAVATSYRHNLMCRWILRAPPGHTVRLSFSHFVIEDSPNCTYDYLEVHDTSDQRIGRYCGVKTPPTLTSSGRQLQVIFRTDDSVTRDGFQAHFIFLNERSACGGDFYLSQGVVRSPLYPRPYLSERDCVWVLHVADGRQIRLNFTHFDIASEGTCTPSYLEILNGGQATSPVAGRFCGRSPPSNFVSDTNTLRLHFVSGSNEPGTGFEVYYDSALSGCGGTTGGTSGSIVSPNYPQPYGHNAECRWNIRVNEGSLVSLMVVDMDIETHLHCRYDALEIYDGPSDGGKRLSQLCNDQQRPGTLMSTGRDMFLRFRTDASSAGRGFHVVYTALCNVHIVNQPYGVIESPNYPEPSPHNANCTWTIEALSGHNISVAFSFLELEHNNKCTYDYVEINETDSEGLPKRLGRFCGDSSLPAPVMSTKNVVKVHYVTDGSVSSRGFRLEFATRGCGGILTKRLGTIETPNYPHGYPKNSECLWVIKAPLGQRVQLSFEDIHLESVAGCAFDFVRVHGGPDITSPKLAEICSSSTSASELVSHGNTMALHFRSDSSIQGKGFRANYHFDRRGCGGRFSVPSAVIMSPGYPANYDAQDDCRWEIRVAEGHVVKLQMLDFSMPASVNCTDSYLAVYDNMPNGDQLLLRHCGEALPQPVNITSSGSQLRLRMKASGSSAGKGFKARYSTECGATLNADASGTFSTPEYPHFSPEAKCSWIIRTSQPNEQVSLTMTHLSMPGSDCTHSNVTVHDGDSAEAPVVRTLCTSQLPAAIVSRGGALFVHATHVILRATYAAFHSGCGGEINSLDGNVASHGYPDTYLPSQDCVWRINAAMGNMMQLTFSSFALEASEFCNKDYLEVRDRSAHGRLLGRFCGDEIPTNITRANGLWLKFHSDDTDVAAGFSAHFSTLRNVDLEGTSGVIESPLYPHDAIGVGDFTWTLHVPDDLYPRISWDAMFSTDAECWASKLILVDGIDEGSPQAARYCGPDKPDPLVLRSSHVQLRFSSTGGYSRWKMRWEAVNSSYLQSIYQAQSGSACSFRVELSNASSEVNITSPGFPEKYGDDLNCTWSVVAPPMRIAKVTFDVVDLRSWESIDNCFYDYVTIYDVNPRSSSERRSLRQVCGQIPIQSNLPGPLVSSTRFMAVRFLTVGNDRPEVIGRGFSARVRSACGGNISEPTGVLQDSDVLDTELQCSWHIYSDRRRPLKITLESINLPSDGGACRETFIQILNGGQSDSPPLGQGKFCGSSSRLQELPKTSSSAAFIVYRRRTPQKGQFRLRWEESGIVCGGPVQLSREMKSREVSSPGYPHAGPSHSVTCDWTIRGPPRSRIRVDFPDSFHMRHGCHSEGSEHRTDYVEVFDGGTANAPSLKVFCGSDVGDSLVSSGNLMALRYVQTGAAGDFLGFRANVMLAECGGTLWPFSGRSRNLEELREKLIEGANFDCAWQLRSMDQTLVALSVKGLSLSESPGCTGMDFLEVRDGNRTGPVLAQICGANSSLDVQSSENSMFLRVKLSSGTRHNPRSLMLRWHSEFSQCGGELTAPQGVFSSPGYPNPLEERRHCYWTIAAPEGHRVSLTIEGNVNDCTAVLQVMERFYRRTVECGHSLPLTYESFKSRVVLSYTFQRLAGGQGIRVTYDTGKELPCWQTLSEPSGTLEAPAEALVAGSHYACEWTLELQPNQTLAVTLDRINVTALDNANCKNEFLHISRRLCKPGDREVMVPDNENPLPSTTAIHYTKGHNQTSGGFSATYRVNDCGGRVRVSDNTQFIATPRFPENYSPNTDCVWIVEPEVWGTQIKLNVSSFALEDNCSADWLDVRSGNNGLAPSINKYCGQRSPGTLVGTAFMLIFHADGTGAAKGFNISLTAVGLACGGLVHGRGEQSLQSPNYPHRYPANAECDWTVDVQRGYRARLAFRGRFDIEASTGCTADYVKVFNERAEDQWEPNPVGSFCGLEAPEPIETTTHRARVLFRSNGGVEADGFHMVVTKACGDRYEDDEGDITSPRFPENYANNLNCPYLIVVPEGSHLELSFDTENFELENADGCKYDNLTLYEGNSTSSPVVGGPWCGNTAPGNYSVASSVLLMFRTDWSSAGKGFRLQYRISRCGGNLTAESGSFSLLPSMTEGENSARCKWNIRVAEGRVVELRLQLADRQHGTVHSTMHNTDCSDGFVSSRVQVLDGEGDDAAQIALFCGREGGPDTFKSTGRSMTVVLAMNTMYMLGTGFRASYRSTLGVNQGCGGTLRQESGVLVPPSRGSASSYPGGPLNCLWVIVSRSGYGLELNVTALNLGNSTRPCNAASTDFLEVWDSLDEQQEPLIRLCGQRPPEAPLRSAGNTLLVHMVTKALGEGAGFSAGFRELPPLCGGTLNVSGDAWQTLQSPGFPSGSPANVRCLWVLRGQESVTYNGVPPIGAFGEGEFRDVIIRVKEMRLPCEDGAYLALITDEKYSDPRPLRLCGSSAPQEWLKPHSAASRVQLLLDTGRRGGQAKLKLEYGTMRDANLTYSQPSGIIHNVDYPGWTTTAAPPTLLTVAPVNTTATSALALYFIRFNVGGPVNNSCPNIFMQVRDGSVSSRVLSHICGDINPGPVFSTGNRLSILVKNAPSNHIQVGWSHRYLMVYFSSPEGAPAGCGGNVTASEGALSSPGYPETFTQRRTCVWYVTGRARATLQLSFVVFAFNSSAAACEANYLDVYNGHRDSPDAKITRLCGQDIPATLQSTGSQLLVKMVTNEKNYGPGFYARFKAVHDDQRTRIGLSYGDSATNTPSPLPTPAIRFLRPVASL